MVTCNSIFGGFTLKEAFFAIIDKNGKKTNLASIKVRVIFVLPAAMLSEGVALNSGDFFTEVQATSSEASQPSHERKQKLCVITMVFLTVVSRVAAIYVCGSGSRENNVQHVTCEER